MSDRLGVTVPFSPLDLRASLDLAREAEALGFTDAWSAETSGPDGLSVATALGVATQNVRIGCAIIPAFTRPPALIAMGALAAQQASGGRFCLGLGASSPVIVERWMGTSFDRPLMRVRETMEAVRVALSGEKASYEGRTVAMHGFRLEQPPEKPIPVFLAALGPKMLALAAEQADGIALFLAAERGVEIAGAAAPGLELVERIVCAPDEPVEDVTGFARWMLAPYLAVPAYNDFIARQGFDEEAESIAAAWSAGDRHAARAAVSDRLVEALVIMGPAEKCRERLESFRAAGLDTPILWLLSTRGPVGIADALRAMAPG